MLKRICKGFFICAMLLVFSSAMAAEVATADIISCQSGDKLGRAVLIERPSDQGIKMVKITIKVGGLTGSARCSYP